MRSLKDLFTIIYYTSNREDEAFEEKIRKKLLEVAGDIPIISVSQKPTNFGRNICVGEVGTHDANLFRQIQIGCEAAETPYVISAEADCLYPPDYFQFIPPSPDGYYRFDNLYILNEWGKDDCAGFFRKDSAPFAQISGRRYYRDIIKKALKGRPYWVTRTTRTRVPIFIDKNWKAVSNVNPILDLKTFHGMRKHTTTFGYPVDKIPYWGSAKKIRKWIWGN